MMNLLDFRLNEKLILFIVHYFIFIVKLALQNLNQNPLLLFKENDKMLDSDSSQKQSKKMNNAKGFKIFNKDSQFQIQSQIKISATYTQNQNLAFDYQKDVIIILIMLSGQNYKEFIEEQGEIERNIAQGWGYQLNSHEYVPKREKVSTNLKVACIEPLRKIFDLPVSKKLQQVDEELLMLQNQRKLNELTDKAFQAKSKGEVITEQESAAIRMMHQCVEEYNFIVNHRHIVEKNTEKARKILGIQKSESKELFQQIHQLKSQLGNSTLSNTIKINTQIAKLYKKYSRIVPKSLHSSERLTSQQSKSIVNRAFTSVNNSISNVGTSKLSPNKNSATNKISDSKLSQAQDSRTKKQSLVQIKDLMIMQQLNESEQGDSMTQSRLMQEQMRMQPQSMLIHHGFAKLQRRVSEYAPPRRRFVTVIDAKQKEKQQKKERMTTTIEQAYEKKDVIHKGKRLDRMLQEHHDVIDVWKQRINENKQKNNNFYLKFQAKNKAKKFKSLKNTKRNIELEESSKDNEGTKNFAMKFNYQAEQIKQNLAQKQKIISLILRKKESKYKRIPGTQILQKNDVNQTAKLILGISKHADQHQSYKSQANQSIQKIQQENSPQWEKIQVNDEKLYWSMCKNEKMNILLKSRKQE